MLNSLRSRLFVSFAVVLLITVCLIGVSVLVFLQSRPLPTGETISSLTATLLDLRFVEVAQIGGMNGAQTSVWTQVITNEAGLRDVRLLLVTFEGQVLYDSSGKFETGSYLKALNQQQLIPDASRPMFVSLYEGRFRDPNGKQWLYVAQAIRPHMEMRGNTPLLLAAAPVPRPTLRQVIRVFGDNLLSPLARALLLGLLAALVLSALIARSVARPLQQISTAARRIANGDLGQRVPVNGPQETRTLAGSFNVMVGQVAASQQAQRDFMANVSHDLRTPLTSIQGFSQAIMDGVASDPASAQHAAQIIHDEAARLHRMVEELLDMARIEAGRIEMRRNAVQVNTLLQAISDSLSGKAQEKGLRLETDIAPNLPRVPGDGDRLAQVFTNLIDNAIKHTPAGGVVQVRAAAQDGVAEISVADTGEGIPPGRPAARLRAVLSGG